MLGRKASAANRRLSGVGLASYIGPPVFLFHVLLAVGFPLGLVRAGRVGRARKGHGGLSMLVVDVSLEFLCGGPAILVVSAARDGALERTTVGFEVFVQVADPGK